MKTTKLFFMAALALMTAACSNDDNDLTTQQPQKAKGITITAQLAPKTGGATTRAVSEDAVNKKIVAECSTPYVADATITAVDGEGAATITFTVEEGTPDDTPCTLVYPYDAAKDDHTGVKDAATLLAAQDGTLSANLDVRVAAQFAIFKFTTKSVPSAGESLEETNVTKLTVTIGAQDYVITPASAMSTLYAALPAVSGQTVSFTATDGSNLYAASKDNVSFAATKYYQSTVKMGKVIEVFKSDDPKIDDFVSPSPSLNYLHIGLDQAYAIAKQLSTQNGGATVAVVYNHNGPQAKYALSSDTSAKENTGMTFFLKNYRMFLATLW